MEIGPLRVNDPASPWHRQSVSLTLSEEGVVAIRAASEEADVWISPGWVDLIAWSNQPQVPSAEGLAALAERARQGGFTAVGLAGWHGWYQPEVLTEIQAQAKNLSVAFLLWAAWADPDGRIAPLQSLREAGAIGWILPPEWPIPWRTLPIALPYLREVGGKLLLLPFWSEAIGEKGVPEVPELALAGWQGIPTYAETVALHTIAALWRAYGGDIAVGPLTTHTGLQEAKRQGVPAFSGVSYAVGEASLLLAYEAFWKLHPPLRSGEDRRALVQALIRLELGAMASWDYQAPPEEKLREWATAAVGQPTLEVAVPLVWGVLRQHAPERWGLSRLIRLVSEYPRRWLGLPYVGLREKHPLDFTVFRLAAEPYPLPEPWARYSTDLRVIGTIRCLADADSLRSQIL
ncbi:MAG: hypothetical protein N3A68_01870 [Bacteroidia bacterium]|jgi:dihydroorotase|nr:hypothetical protein [Bacteroidia bacterium]